jgi:hypothetical protein
MSEVTRWERVEVDMLRLVAAGLALALPVAWGEMRGDLAAGMAGALGALIVSSSGHAGSLRARLFDLGASTAAGATGIVIGLGVEGPAVVRAALTVAAAVLVGAAGGIRPSLAKAGAQFLVFLIIGGTLTSSAPLVVRLVAHVVAGACFASALTLAAYGLARCLGLAGNGASTGGRSWSADLGRWRGSLGSTASWQYPIALASCLLVAQLIAPLLHEQRSDWILLTVVLVVPRDRSGGFVRIVQRALGTALGVLVGAVLLGPIPTWAMVCMLGVLGAARVHLKAANYAAYALVMTPLVSVLSGLGHTMSAELLRERLIDTAIGCTIALIVRHGVSARPSPVSSEVR